MNGRLTRRQALARGGGLVLGAAAASAPGTLASAARRSSKRVPLPSPGQVRRDFQRMVDFGPRVTGSRAQKNFVSWLRREFQGAGLDVLAPDHHSIERWEAREFGLEVLDGASAGPVEIATYYPRSKETAPEGITAPLAYAGTGSANPSGPAGSIFVIDLPAPAPLTAGFLLPQSTYRYWPGHDDAEWATTPYARSWIAPGLGVPLDPFKAAGAAAVVFILDNISFAALKGAYVPFTSGFESLPALYVDRDTGQALRQQAMAGQQARFMLSAKHRPGVTSDLTAVLPGSTDETVIFNTHTDGQNFAEENGGVAFVHLARHFASLSKRQRLKRTLVFACWSGHMYGDLPETEGWMENHPDLVEKAVAALTVEHLGCQEWIDDEAGYRASGEPEPFGIYTSEGKISDLARDTIPAHQLTRSTLLRPPPQFGVGGAFESAGVPQIGAIAGPAYLVTISDNGEMDKLDEALAARQIGWIADMAKRIDRLPASALRA